MPEVPDHRLDRRIGRGSYGEVWRAVNVMGAGRAVKVVWRGQFESDRPYEREFEALQRYEVVSRVAEGLVTVLHIGRTEDAGFFYYVMELADPLTAPPAEYAPATLRALLAAGGPLGGGAALALATQLASGLAALHGHGLVHRDVKPDNVIFVAGRAALADIGLVTTAAAGEPGLGTPGYVPPEGQATRQADIFALGIVLWQSLTGGAAAAFPAVSAAWLSRAEPMAVELLDVALRAAEADSARRYPTVEALLADLALIRSGQSAREVRGLTQRVRWLRRLGWATGAAAGLGGGLLVWERWEHAAELAEREKASARAEAQTQLQNARIYEAAGLRRSVQLGDRARASALLSEAARDSVAPGERARLRDELAAGWSRNGLIGPATGGGPEGVRRATLEPDGAVRVRTVGMAETLHLSVPGRPVAELGRFNAPATHFSAALADGGVAVWELGTGAVRLTWPGGGPALGAFRPDGKAFFHTVPPLGVVRGVDLTAAPEPDTFDLVFGASTALAPSPDGRVLALGWQQADGAEEIRLWDREAKSFSRTWQLPPRSTTLPPPAFAWSPDGQRLAMARGADPVRVFRVGQAVEPLLFIHHRDPVVGLAWSPDGQNVVSTDWGATTRVWSAATGEEQTVVAEPGLSVSWSGDGSRLEIDQFPTGPLCYEVKPGLVATYAPGGPPHGVVFSPDSRWLAADGHEALVIYDLQTHREAARLPQPGVLNPVWPEKAGALYAVSPSGVARWPVQTGPAQPLRFGKLDRVSNIGGSHLTASADGLTLAWSDAAAALRVWRPGTGEPGTWGSAGSSDQLLLSPDGRWLSKVPWHGNAGLEVWDLTTRATWRVPQGEAGAIFYSAFTPDSTALLTNDGQRGLLRWPCGATAPQRLLAPDAPRNARAGVAISADGKLIAAQGALGKIALLDAVSGRVLIRLEVPSRDFASGPLTLSADGAWLAANSWQGFVHVWNLRELRSRLAEVGLDFD